MDRPYLDVLVPEILDPLTVPFKKNCVQLFHSICVWSESEPMVVRLMLSTLWSTRLSSTIRVWFFSQFYCIVSNDQSYNGMLLVFTEELSSSLRGRKMSRPLEEQKYYICIGTGGLQLLWDIATVMIEEALVKCITYLLVCWKFRIMEATVDRLRLGWTLSPVSLSDRPWY